MDSSRSRFIKAQALQLGFQKVGITSARPTLKSKENLEAWLRSGNHATMDWMAKRKAERGNIHTYFPDAKSVVSVGMNYYTGSSGDIVGGGDSMLQFSNYAWGDDYHGILKEKLNQLLGQIKKVVNKVKGLVCVDTAPVMEKVWAQRAGLGWQGKHTNLISRDFGSWLFLGELLLNITLDYDPPFNEDLCGTCTACIEACPTRALSEYQIDAKKCISYFTIEHKGVFVENYIDKLNGWIFGCDICQVVCPWNIKFQRLSEESRFQPKLEIREWSLQDWRTLDRVRFNSLFKGSPVTRTKYHGLKRNIEHVVKSICGGE